ncbi:uncharacterized protein [Aegilops tauschii subsp. strangulata]|uniref:uncharacterized protein n=1 Tax=Aegilops tauschii subsp. strangulata TaxID=200361 RepID=UPI001ABC0198
MGVLVAGGARATQIWALSGSIWAGAGRWLSTRRRCSLVVVTRWRWSTGGGGIPPPPLSPASSSGSPRCTHLPISFRAQPLLSVDPSIQPAATRKATTTSPPLTSIARAAGASSTGDQSHLVSRPALLLLEPAATAQPRASPRQRVSSSSAPVVLAVFQTPEAVPPLPPRLDPRGSHRLAIPLPWPRDPRRVQPATATIHPSSSSEAPPAVPRSPPRLVSSAVCHGRGARRRRPRAVLAQSPFASSPPGSGRLRVVRAPASPWTRLPVAGAPQTVLQAVAVAALLQVEQKRTLAPLPRLGSRRVAVSPPEQRLLLCFGSRRPQLASSIAPQPCFAPKPPSARFCASSPPRVTSASNLPVASPFAGVPSNARPPLRPLLRAGEARAVSWPRLCFEQAKEACQPRSPASSASWSR